MLRRLLFTRGVLVLQLHPVLELLPRWCESLMGITVSFKLFHLEGPPLRPQVRPAGWRPNR